MDSDFCCLFGGHFPRDSNVTVSRGKIFTGTRPFPGYYSRLFYIPGHLRVYINTLDIRQDHTLVSSLADAGFAGEGGITFC